MANVLESLNAGLHHALDRDPRVVLLGEDLLDPYGGAFKASRGLSTAFPGRVFTTPISEGGFIGLATGMALRGLRPVVEIMFGDFVTLAADQIINHAAKFRWMYNDQVRAPLVIRTPMGGRRGYGPTHSQTLEKLFLGVPGLRVIAPAAVHDPGGLLESVILDQDDPVLFVESKLLYLARVWDPAGESEFELETIRSPGGFDPPAYRVAIAGAPDPTLTLAAYGYMAELACQALRRLAYEREIFAELIVFTQLAPFKLEPLIEAVRRTRRLLLLEEGTQTAGWGAEIAARLAEAPGLPLQRLRRLGALDLPIPASGPLEAAILPGVAEITQAALKMV